MEADADKLVSIIVVTMGVKNYLRDCLDSLKTQSYPNVEVIIIDNSLNKHFCEKAQGWFPSAKIYSPKQNLYYCDSLNKGIQLSNGEFILCLNDDLVLDKTYIEEALKGFSIKDNIGMVSGKILRLDSLTLDSAGLFLTPWRTARERGYGQKNRGQFEKNEAIFGVSGCAAFYSKKMLAEIKKGGNYFNPAFRMFYEDLDISWRANNRGWHAYYVPSAKAFHLRGGSFRPDPGIGKFAGRRYLNDELHADLIKNRYLTILRNETVLGLLVHFLPIVLYDLYAWAFVLFFRPKVIKVFLNKLKNIPRQPTRHKKWYLSLTTPKI